MTTTRFPVVALATSAGGIPALGAVLGALPADFPAAVVVLQHRAPTRGNVFGTVLSRASTLPVVAAATGEPIRPGLVYVADADQHLLVTEDWRFACRDGARIKGLLSSANPLFESAARAMGPHLIAVVLTGGGSDATDGVQSVKAHGGFVIAQDQSTSLVFGMPRAAIASGSVDRILPIDAIAPALVSLVAARTSERRVLS